jgi:hypothetical protein
VCVSGCVGEVGLILSLLLSCECVCVFVLVGKCDATDMTCLALLTDPPDARSTCLPACLPPRPLVCTCLSVAASGALGLGRKSIGCVSLLSLGKRDFPVDVNVGRICARLGWIPLQVRKCLCGCVGVGVGTGACRITAAVRGEGLPRRLGEGRIHREVGVRGC